MAIVNHLSAVVAMTAMALSPALAKDYSAAETDVMNHALMTYALTWPGNYLYDNKKGFDFYLKLQDHDPDAKFTAGFGDAGKKLKPYAGAAHLQVTKAMMESGHNVMKVAVSDYHAIAPDQARALVDARCGPACGGQSLVTLRKYSGVWEITKFQTMGSE